MAKLPWYMKSVEGGTKIKFHPLWIRWRILKTMMKLLFSKNLLKGGKE